MDDKPAMKSGWSKIGKGQVNLNKKYMTYNQSRERACLALTGASVDIDLYGQILI